jgi:hypothetical protein
VHLVAACPSAVLARYLRQPERVKKESLTLMLEVVPRRAIRQLLRDPGSFSDFIRTGSYVRDAGYQGMAGVRRIRISLHVYPISVTA